MASDNAKNIFWYSNVIKLINCKGYCAYSRSENIKAYGLYYL